MVVIFPDNKIRKVELTGDDIQRIIEELERVPHNLFEFMRYDKIIKKLKISKNIK